MYEITVRLHGQDDIIERLIVDKKRISIGRTSDNDLVLEARGVSRRHALIECTANACVIIDNESLGGTLVNNRKVSEEVLRDGDIIRIDQHELLFRSDSLKINTSGVQPRLLLVNARAALVAVKNVNFSVLPIRELTNIGTASTVDVHVKGFGLHPVHAHIALSGAGYQLVEMGKRARTWCNDVHVSTPVKLKSGDLILVGRSQFRFVCL